MPDSGLGADPKRPIYLDHQATTPLDPRVLEAMLPWMTGPCGDPQARWHRFGRDAEQAVEAARAAVAGGIGADPREILFTSGATEANNLAIIGAGRFRRDNRDKRDRIVTIATEHASVLRSCAALEREGFLVTVLPVQSDGVVDVELLRRTVTERTAIVSIAAAEPELGVLQPIADIARVCRDRGAWFHCDAAQAAGKAPIEVEPVGIDLMSLSGHKMYGPKGIGALYLRRRPRVRLEPLLHGGPEEQGLRPGALPVSLCVGLGRAVKIACDGMAAEGERLYALRERFVERLLRTVPDLRVNGHPTRRLPGSLNIILPGVAAEALAGELDHVAISAGRAGEPAHVLRAIGLDELAAAASVRIGFGRFTTEPEADDAADAIAAKVAEIRRGYRSSATAAFLPTRGGRGFRSGEPAL